MNSIKLTIVIFVIEILWLSFLYSDWLEMKNQYLKITCDNKTGRFAIKTTGGAPELTTDQNSMLLYNNDDSFTSFTTIRIDGQNYKFGSDKGLFKGLKKENNKIKCIWLVKNIEVTQSLMFVNSPTTGNKDTVELLYKVINKDYRLHKIGLRVMLDTYLGKEDGAPFRIPGIGEVTTETLLDGDLIPEYWYAYDDLVDSTIRAQGILKWDVPLQLQPDKVVYASWLRFDQHLWDFSIKKGRNFSRTALGPKDSAVAIYWDTEKFNPNESFTAKTYYGIYGASIYKGEVLNVSLSGPAFVPEDIFIITADIQNSSPNKINNVKAKLILPEGLTLSLGETSHKFIGTMKSKEIKQAVWQILPGILKENISLYKVVITGFINDQKNIVKVERKIKVKEKKDKIMEELNMADMNVQKLEKGVKIEIEDVLFKFNSAELTGKAEEKLQTIGEVLKKYIECKVKIYGHTDNVGSKKYNKQLSEARAKSVLEFFLKNQYIVKKQGSYKGFGEEKPIVSNSSFNGRKRNRRVEVMIIP